jgi:hypothetical protein
MVAVRTEIPSSFFLLEIIEVIFYSQINQTYY